jgi:hypothetical protein
VQAFPGATIASLTHLVQTHKASIVPFDAVIYHVVTNDVVGRSVEEIVSLYSNLIAITRKVKPVKIIISSILPRPVDVHLTKNKLIQINQKLKAYLCPRMKVQFVASYKAFLYKGEPRRELYAIKDGGLHLNMDGVNRLRFCFVRVVNHLSS